MWILFMWHFPKVETAVDPPNTCNPPNPYPPQPLPLKPAYMCFIVY